MTEIKVLLDYHTALEPSNSLSIFMKTFHLS
jgi:hypothetical protein